MYKIKGSTEHYESICGCVYLCIYSHTFWDVCVCMMCVYICLKGDTGTITLAVSRKRKLDDYGR